MTNDNRTPESEYENDYAPPDDVADELIEPSEADAAESVAAEDAPSYVVEDDAPEPDDYADLPPLPDLDIDAALAAVDSLSTVVEEQQAADERDRARRDATERAERERIEAEQRAAEERARFLESYEFPHPPLSKQKRGQLSSVIPALLLIASGAYLTFALTLSDTPPGSGVVGVIVCGVIGLTLLSHWLASGRWARGALFGGLALIVTGGLLFAIWELALLTASQGWLPLVIGLGAALLLTGLLGRPAMGRLVMVGLAVMLGAGVVWALDSGLLGAGVNDALASVMPVLAPVALVIAVLLLLVPSARRSP